MDSQNIIARRITRERRSGMLVNLGIGILTQVANHVPEGIPCVVPSGKRPDRNGPTPEEGMARPTLTDAGGRPVTALPGASAMSFGLIRSGHLDLTVLGGLQVDLSGRLANSMISNKI